MLWGIHPVRAALANAQRRIDACYATDNAYEHLQAGSGGASVAGLHESALRRVTARDLDALLPPGAVHQGIAIETAPLPHADLDRILEAAPETDNTADGPRILLVLDQVTDPHNVGAILRSAAVFGAVALVTTDRHAPPESGTLAKSAAGALDIVPWVRVSNLAQSLDAMKDAGFWVAGMAGDATLTVSSARMKGVGTKLALILGAEGAGLRRLTKEKCDILVRIPMSYANKEKCVNLIDSLNVSNAAAVALYEINQTREDS